MKKTLLLITVLVALFGACNRNKAVDPADPLYRTWRQTQVVYNDGRTAIATEFEGNIVSFRPNGMIQYGANGRYAACCSPNRFNRKGNTLDLIDVNAVPVPPVDNRETCYVLDCSGHGPAWQILKLTDEQLILKTIFGTATYQPYP